jgi:hypothetical protein
VLGSILDETILLKSRFGTKQHRVGSTKVFKKVVSKSLSLPILHTITSYTYIQLVTAIPIILTDVN